MKLYNKSKNVTEFSIKDFNNKNVPKSGKPTFIIFYADWCPHCRSAEVTEMMEALGEVLPKKAGVDVGAFSCADSQQNEIFAQDSGIIGYPTFRYYNSNGEISEYRGPRDPEAILKFLLKNS